MSLLINQFFNKPISMSVFRLIDPYGGQYLSHLSRYTSYTIIKLVLAYHKLNHKVIE